ncbi:MAG: amidohydrolase family protein [Candidatus Eremiobacteraeota bacterium]|nr:amidohydrolase family protein [Candidatus Eremiobacteraeota bacterium]
MYALAADGGARACGVRAGAIATGRRADLIELQTSDDERDDDATRLDRYVFASLDPRPARVMTGGRWRS